MWKKLQELNEESVCIVSKEKNIYLLKR
jgi:hypothetical protein